MAEVVYLLCAFTSVACALLLLASYRRTRLPVILWTSVCFIALAANNTLLFIDLAVVAHVDLTLWRNGLAVLGLGALLYGLISVGP